MKARKKQINDRYGHMAGDEAIVNAARILNESFHASDIKARLGGDEFIVFVMEAEERDSQILLTRLCERLAENNQSMSIGVITDVSIDNIIARADDSMYAEKRTRLGNREIRH